MVAGARGLGGGDFFGSAQLGLVPDPTDPWRGLGATVQGNYRFYVEVPPGTGHLAIDIWDADAGAGNPAAQIETGVAGDQTNDTSFRSAATYTYAVTPPGGAAVTPRFTSGSNNLPNVPNDSNARTIDCPAPGHGHQAWCTLYSDNAPRAGRWLVTITSVDDRQERNAYGIRARDEATLRDLNVYADNAVSVGNENLGSLLPGSPQFGQYRLFPYVTAGCSADVANFDADNSNQYVLTQVGDPPAVRTYLDNGTAPGTVAVSGIDVWTDYASNQFSFAPTPAAPFSVRYGMWSLAIDIDPPGGASNPENETTIYVRNSTTPALQTAASIAGQFPNAKPIPTAARIYLEDNAGNAPVKPYITMSVTPVSPQPGGFVPVPTVGQSTRLAVKYTIHNTSGSAIRMDGAGSPARNLTVSLPGNPEITFQGVSATQGTPTGPSINATTGTITWAPGDIASSPFVATLTYLVNYTPTALGADNVTPVPGTPGAARAAWFEFAFTGSEPTGSAAPVYEFGPLCNMPVQTGITIPVPVSISAARAERVSASSVKLEFVTASQIGVGELKVMQGRTLGDLGRLSHPRANLTARDTFEPKRVSIVADSSSDAPLWLVETSTDGRKVTYGPYAIGSGWVGDADASRAVAWSQASVDSATFDRAERARRVASAPDTARVEVSARGLQRVGFDALLAAGVDLSGVPAAEIAVTRRGVPVDREVTGGATFGPGSAVVFAGVEQPDSIYDRTSAYVITHDAARVEAVGAVYAGGAGIDGIGSATMVRRVEAQAGVQPVYYEGSTNDAWFIDQLSRDGAASVSREYSTMLANVDGSTGGSLAVRLHGGIELETAGFDHSVEIALNGQVLTHRRWDGIQPDWVNLAVPAGLITNGTNTLRLRLMNDTAEPIDIVYLDEWTLTYTGANRASDGRADFLPTAPSISEEIGEDLIGLGGFEPESPAACASGETNCGQFRLAGLQSSAPTLWRFSADGEASKLHGFSVRPDAAGFAAVAALEVQPGDRIFAADAAGFHQPTVEPGVDPVEIANGNHAWIAIADPAFVDGLTPLVAQRSADGLTPRVITVDSIYARYSGGDVDPAAIRAFVADAHSRWGTRYVLLVGADTYDYHDRLGLGSVSFIPSIYGGTDRFVRHAPKDGLYGDVNGDQVADLAVGRFIARTSGEVARLVRKTLDAEGFGATRTAVFVGDRADPALDFGVRNLALSSGLGGPWLAGTQQLALGSYPATGAGVSQARADLAAAVNGGRRLVSYYGHSAPTMWSFNGLLTANSVNQGLFTNATSPAVVLQWGCYGAYHVLPTFDTVAHAMLAGVDGGAAAYLGSSTLTQSAHDEALAAELLPRVGTPGRRLGDAVVESLQSLNAREPGMVDVLRTTTLLGDPALRIH